MMVERTKSWIKENFMGIVLAAMFSAFWYNYAQNEIKAAQFRDTIISELRNNDSKTQTLSRILRDDPDTDKYDKELLTDFIKKLSTRSGK